MGKYLTKADVEYIISVRRQIHRFPEIGFDLPKTVALVKEKLEAMGVAYTEKYGKGSVVATVNPDCSGPVIALRADMDALPLQETADVPYRSEIPSAMHACGHDAHTAMLLGAAKVLKRIEKDLKCSVRLLFQPNEEGEDSGAEMMVRNGVMDDVERILCLHVENALESGCIGIYAGEYMAACHTYSITFRGKSAHATVPQWGHDALAMAVKAYNSIYLMKARELEPFSRHVLSISSIQAGYAHNIIPGEAKMLISFRYYDMQTHDFIDGRIKEICLHASQELGGTVEFDDGISCPVVYNDPDVIAVARKAAVAAVGEEKVVVVPQKLSSEDFSHYLTKCPGALIRLGTRNEEKGCVEMTHNSGFVIDEDALKNGSELFVRFVLACGDSL